MLVQYRKMALLHLLVLMNLEQETVRLVRASDEALSCGRASVLLYLQEGMKLTLHDALCVSQHISFCTR